jgi:hypothetical protein
MLWPAAVKPMISAFPLTEDVLPLQVALEFDCTTSAAIRPCPLRGNILICISHLSFGGEPWEPRGQEHSRFSAP